MGAPTRSVELLDDEFTQVAPEAEPSSSLGARMGIFTAGVVIVDLVGMAIAAAMAQFVRFGATDADLFFRARGNFGGVSYTIVSLVIVGLWLACLIGVRSYSVHHTGTGAEEYKAVAQGSALCAGIVGITCYLGNIPVARGFVAVAFPVGLLLLILGRWFARRRLARERSQGRLTHHAIAVGTGEQVSALIAALRAEPAAGYDITGVCLIDDDMAPLDGVGIQVFGGVNDVRAAVRASGAHAVIVASMPGTGFDTLRRIAWACEGLGVDLLVVPSLMDIAGSRIRVRPVVGLPLLHIKEPRFTGRQLLVKSGFDRATAALGLLLVAPVVLSIVIAIKLNDRGPVLFRQSRVGRDGNTFSCYKFRSMVVDAENRLDEIRHLNEHDGVLFKLKDDPRITRVGRFLRRFSLDEIPQLLNVLKGDMSLVGPRPPLPGEVAQYDVDVRRRLLVKPGITGLWQVSGRSDLSWQQGVRLDLYYVENWSFTQDLAILVRTGRAVLTRQGSY